MKKILFAAVSVVALFACTKDVITDAPESAIDFASNTQCAVKSTVVDGSNFASFQVYAFNGEDVIMGDMEVKKEGSAWTYSPKKYWPATGTVDFFGVYMDRLGETTENYYRSQYGATAANGLSFGLEMAVADGVVNAAKIPDAVYATAIGKKKEDGAVHMNFRHAMAQIAFQIKNATTAKNDIVVTSGDVYVEGLYYAGNYTAPKKYSTTESLGIGSWDFTETKADYLFKTDGVRIKAGETAGILADQCMALPQAATDVKLVLNCTIKQNGVVIFSGEKTAECNIDWKEGHKYTYIFLLEDEHLESNVIEFTAGVTAIENGGTQDLPPNN